MPPFNTCPVCDCKVEREWFESTAALYHCLGCGDVVVTREDDVNLRSPRLREAWDPVKLSALIREQSIRFHCPVWLQDRETDYRGFSYEGVVVRELTDLLNNWPRTVPERIDRTLCNLAVLSPTAGHTLRINPDDRSLLLAASVSEAAYHLEALKDSGFLRGELRMENAESGFELTPKGWARVVELTQGKSTPHTPVFVAMWFGDTKHKAEMNEAYTKGIHPAIEGAGYRATRVDLSEHNDWIMDKVLGDIRLAPFVVADFTGHRNGVYFEAGFARGLGIPVIHTCHSDHLDQAHFDTKQLNHVLWKTVEELRVKLHHRILGTIGMGPYPAPNLMA